MVPKSVNIISFNVPYPANYGGVIDVYYRVKALCDIGYSVNLHCFQYGRATSSQLENICNKVFYYQRNMSFFLQFSSVPFIVRSRAVPDLLKNLDDNDWPIIFEGLHCSFFISSPKLSQRLKVLRAHNVEHNYYSMLAGTESNLLKKIYFKMESLKLRSFERKMVCADAILSISESDNDYFNSRYGRSYYIPPFHPDNEIVSREGRGQYAVYQGNLSVKENCKAADFILKVATLLPDFHIVIAGKDPDKTLMDRIQACANVELVANPSDDKMAELVANAQINLLPTFQPTGFKLKLLYALFRGRFCLVTRDMVAGTGLESLCVVADSVIDFTAEIRRLRELEFTREMIEERKFLLEGMFSNMANANKIKRIIDDISNLKIRTVDD